MIRKIYHYNDGIEAASILRVVSDPVTEFDDKLKQLVKDMFETLRNTESGIALAAPQIGKSLRLFIMDTEHYPDTVIINPEIVSATGRMKFDEGCLSFPNLFLRKKRKAHVVVKYKDINGNDQATTFVGKDAVVVQHEIDHLNGVLLIDQG